MTKTKTIYFGAGWFSDRQNKAYQEAKMALKANSTIDFKNSFFPLDNQYKNLDVAKHPELTHDIEWCSATYQSDLNGIKTSDIMLGIYVPDEEDIGLGIELGYAHSNGKFVLLVIPNEDYGKKINLMSWGICDAVIKLSELKTYDFNKPRFNFYDGPTY